MGLLDGPGRGRASSSAAQSSVSLNGASPPMQQGEGSRPAAHHFQHQPKALPKLLTRLRELGHGHFHRHSSPSGKSNSGSSSLSRSGSLRGGPKPGLCPSASQSSLPLRSTAQAELDRQRPALKMRLVTMNMHDELPLGDLTDFVGEVTDFRRRNSKRPSTASARHSLSSTHRAHSSAASSTTGSVVDLPGPEDLPRLPLQAGHPYHVIVVASQECPLASGVLSGKVRTLDGRGWTTVLEEWLCGGTEEQMRKEEEEEPVLVDGTGEPIGPEEEMMVDWEEEKRKDVERAQSRAESASIRSKAPTFEGSETDEGERRGGRGPYVLVEKERLMGIYVAVFVARDCDHLVTGTSKGRVTAGLIGGRLGNKGGVGISLNFASQRMLFISAHLAAHASALEIRKANVLKILHELEVDDFLPSDTPRSDNLTDRFDQTFFMGDLNFRLDISRLHADWLTKSKQYTTALEFDQLRKVLAAPGGVFAGFDEAPISFAPTFKYDLPKRVKQKRSGLLRSPTKQALKRTSKDWKQLKLEQVSSPTDYDSPPQTPAVSTPATPGIMEMLPESVELGGSKLKDEDAISLASSAATDEDFEHLELVDEHGKIIANTAPAEGADPSSALERKKAQVKFMTLVKANSAAFLRKRSAVAAEDKTSLAPPTPSRKHAFSLSGGPPPPILSSAARPPLRGSQSEMYLSQSSQGDSPLSPPTLEAEEDLPVFDSSSKQRVQSYTDRILFKSTVPVSKALPPTPSMSVTGGNSRRGSVFVDAIRALAPHKQLTITEPPGPGLNRSWTTGDATLHSEETSVSNRLGRLFARERGAPTRTVSSSSQRLKELAATSPFDEATRTSSHPTPTGLMPFTLSPEHSPATEEAPTPQERPTRSPRQEATLRSPRRAQSASPTRDESTRWTSLQIAKNEPVNAQSDATAPTSPDERSLASLTPTAGPSASPSTARPGQSQTAFAFAPIKSAKSVGEGTTPAQSTSPSEFSNPWSGQPSPATSPNSTRTSSANHIAFTEATTDPTSQSRPNMYARHSISSGGSGHDPTSAGTNAHGARAFLRQAAGLPRSLTMNKADGDGRDGGLTRLKSFFHLPALPGMKPISLFGDKDGEGEEGVAAEAPWTGPRKGELLVLKYDAVTDLVKMGAYTDHRPVFLDVVIGLGSQEEDEGE